MLSSVFAGLAGAINLNFKCKGLNLDALSYLGSPFCEGNGTRGHDITLVGFK